MAEVSRDGGRDAPFLQVRGVAALAPVELHALRRAGGRAGDLDVERVARRNVGAGLDRPRVALGVALGIEGSNVEVDPLAQLLRHAAEDAVALLLGIKRAELPAIAGADGVRLQ